MSTLYAIDPGTVQSAVVVIKPDRIRAMLLPNDSVLAEILRTRAEDDAHLVIEQIQSYGMAVGREIFETVFWSGRFAQGWEERNGTCWSMLPRRDVKLHLCGSAKAKDANIRQALIDKYGGKAATKKGGPLYKISGDMWAALALAVTYRETKV